MKKVVIIGSGNVATHFAKKLKDTANVIQVYSRNINNAKRLASKINGCRATDNISDIVETADVYIIAIKDDAILPFVKSLPDRLCNALWVHTSGSVDISVFNGYNQRYGILYPLQTFSSSTNIEIENVPFFIEGSTADTTEEIRGIANLFSSKVYEADSHQRSILHVASVFACNFTNYMYTIAEDILSCSNIPFSSLMPLIDETARKIKNISPKLAQTGPAARKDMCIIEKHLAMLSGDEYAIYKLISESIINQQNG